jgi:hypothetical protein
VYQASPSNVLQLTFESFTDDGDPDNVREGA